MRTLAAVSLLVCLLILAGCDAPGTSPSTATLMDVVEPTSAGEQTTESPEATPPAASPLPAETASQAARPDANTVLMSLYRHGGLCATGSECQWQLVIYQSGTYSTGNEAGPISEGVLGAEEMAELRRLIEQTDFAAIRAAPFTDICPTAYDGQESTYTFVTNQGEETFSSCEVQIDPSAPLFAWIEGLIAAIGR